MKLISLVILIFSFQIICSQEFDSKLHCESDLIDESKGSYWYQIREDRCEGQYQQFVYNSTLQIKSLTKSHKKIDLNSVDSLELRWGEIPLKGDIKLQAIGSRRRVDYQMDTGQNVLKKSFKMKTNIMSGLNIDLHQIGFICQMVVELGEHKKSIYIPLRVNPIGEKSQDEKLELVVQPGSELEEIYVTIDFLDKDGKSEKNIIDGYPLERGYYPAGEGIRIPINGLSSNGFYKIVVAADLESGGSDTEDLIIYYSTD